MLFGATRHPIKAQEFDAMCVLNVGGDYKPVEYRDTLLTLQSQGMAFVNEFSNVSYKMILFDSHRSFVNKIIG